MRRIGTGINRNPSVDKFGPHKHGFKTGNRTLGDPPSTPGAEWYDSVQETLAQAIEAGGFTLDPDDHLQLFKLIRRFAVGDSNGFVTIMVEGGTVSLTDIDLTNQIIGFAGELTSDVTVVLPYTSKKILALTNQTTGNFKLTVKTANGAGVQVAQKKRRIVYVSGGGVFDALTDQPKITARVNNKDKVPVTKAESVFFEMDSHGERYGGSTIMDYIADHLAHKQRGYKQIGYLPASTFHSKYTFNGSISLSFSAGWTQMWGLSDTQMGVDPYTYSMDGKGSFTNSAGGSETISLSLSTAAQFQYETLRVYYLEQPNGGTFKVTFTGQQAVDVATINTNGTSSSLKFADIPARPENGMSFVLGNLDAGKKYAIYGFELLNPSRTGFYYNDRTRAGIKLSDFLKLNEAANAQYMANFAPDLVFLNLGTNDAIAKDSPESFTNNLNTYYNRLKAAAPNARLVLIEPQRPINYDDEGSDVSANYRAYSDARAEFAKSKSDCFYVDLPAMLGNWNDMNSLGLMADNVHASLAGKRVVAAAILDALNLPAALPIDTYPKNTKPLKNRHEFSARGAVVPVADGVTVDAIKFGLTGPLTNNCYVDATIMVSMSGVMIAKRVQFYTYKLLTTARGKVDDVRNVTVTEAYRSVGAGTPDVTVTVTKDANGYAVISFKPVGFAAAAWSLVGGVQSGYARREGELIVEY